MANKKENILSAALELFAGDGYNATSTSSIAKEAGVSEGLIFRHFGSKKGLLEAIMEDVEARISQLLAPVIFEEEPKKVIRRIIEMPFGIDPSEYDYWRLQFKLKWEQEYNNPNKMKPLIDKLAWAFTELGYKEPEKEAVLLNQIIDSISTEILRDGKDAQESFQSFLLEKYGV
ncbi:MAG: TetR/AcrR family transcriptional regulator [Lewinellaceae bacterium]|nr:TetR/AcrR family transcriptional regulator [Lewinellaceae bacterium]